MATPFSNVAGEQYPPSVAVSYRHQWQVPGLNDRTTTALESIVSRIGGTVPSIEVTSAHRPPAYNKKVGGARSSQHLKGNAIDITLRGMPIEQKQALVRSILSEPSVRGFGYYPNSESIHFDVRPGSGRAYWGDDYSRASWRAPAWMDEMVVGWDKSGLPLSKDEIKTAQKALSEKGLYDGAIDGDWGGDTRRAMRQFARQADLEVGPEALAALSPGLGFGAATGLPTDVAALNAPDDYISGDTLGPVTDPTPRPRVAADDMSGAPQRVASADGVPMPLLRDGLPWTVPAYNRPTDSPYYQSPDAIAPFDAVINDQPETLLGSAGNDTVPMPMLRADHLPPSITGGPYDISPSPEELTAANYRTNPNRAPMFTPEEGAALSGFQSPEDVVPMTSPRRMPMFGEEDRAMLSGFQTPEDVVPRTSPRRVPMMSEAERAQLSGFQNPEDVVPRSRDSVRPIPTPRENPRRQVAEQPMPGPFLPRPEFPGSLPAAESLPMVATPPDRPIGSLPAAPFEPGEWADPMMGPFDHLGMTADRIQWDQDQAARRKAFEEERSVQAPMTVPIVGDPMTTGNSLVPFINAMPQADAGGLNDRFNNTFDAVGYTPPPSIDRFNDTFAAVGYEPPLTMPDMPADPLMAGNSTVPFSGPVPQPVPMGVAPPMRGIEREARPDALSMPFTAPGRPETMTDFGMPSLFGSMPGLPADGLMMADAGAAVRQVYPDMASTPLPAPPPPTPAPAVPPLPPPVTIDTAPIDSFAWTQEPAAMRAPDYRESFSPTLTGEFGGTQPTQAAGGMPAPQPVPNNNQPIDLTPRSQATINAQQAPSSVPQPQAQADNQQWLRGIVDKHVDSLFGGGIGTMMRSPFGGLFTGSSNPSQTAGNNYAPTGTSSYTNNSGERQSYSHGSYNGQRAVQTPGGTVFAENRDGTYSQVL